jgi:hypothetical protein
MQLPRSEVVAPLVLFALILGVLVFDRYHPGSMLSAVTYTTGVTSVDAATDAHSSMSTSPFVVRESKRLANHVVLATMEHDAACFTQGLLYYEGCVGGDEGQRAVRVRWLARSHPLNLLRIDFPPCPCPYPCPRPRPGTSTRAAGSTASRRSAWSTPTPAR